MVIEWLDKRHAIDDEGDTYTRIGNSKLVENDRTHETYIIKGDNVYDM